MKYTTNYYLETIFRLQFLGVKLTNFSKILSIKFTRLKLIIIVNFRLKQYFWIFLQFFFYQTTKNELFQPLDKSRVEPILSDVSI